MPELVPEDRQGMRRNVPEAVRRRIINEITGVLQESVGDKESRQLYLRVLREAFGGTLTLREQSIPRLELIELTTVCMEHPGGVRSMADCLELLAPESPQTLAMFRLADEWQVTVQFAHHDLRQLRTDLERIDVDAGLLSQVAGWRPEPVPPHCRTAWQLFAYLASATSAGEIPAWLRLLERLRFVVPERSRPEMHRLTRRLREEWGVPDLVPAPAAAPMTATAYLVIQFEKYGGDEKTFIVTHWHQWASSDWQPIRGGDRHVQLTELEAVVDEIVMDAERRWANMSGPVMIEFVLPWQLLNAPVDTWRKELASPMPSQLTAEYTLVIRSLERLRAGQWHRIWRQRWDAIGRSVVGGTVHCAVPDDADVRLETTLKREGAAVVLVLSEPPLPKSIGERQLRTGIKSGVPAVIWHREATQSELCEAVSSMASDFRGVAELPRRVAELRQEAWLEDPEVDLGHLGHGLVILWDDPGRQPGGTGSLGSETGKVRA